MSIFNSLGSNYNLQYVFQSLFSETNGQNLKLKEYLNNKYGGKTTLVYKGREALILALKSLDLPKESAVAINGFTCYAVYKAVHEAGLVPVCLDLNKENLDLNFSPETLEKSLIENANIKAVIVQNTFGYPCDIEKIIQICQKNNLALIEDLAHCLGTKYANGKEAGTVGDLTALSFSQDKVIDAVSGGALVIRNKKYSNLENVQLKTPKDQFKDRLYPSFTYKIRFLYSIGVGKILHYMLKNLDLLSKPMRKGLYAFYSLPDWYCNLVLYEFKKISAQLNHRKQIAKIYAQNLSKKILDKEITENIPASVNLRFPVFVKNRGELIRFLGKQKIYVSDIWYFDVAPECPNAVAISKIILNLPTHINVSRKDTFKIVNAVNLWIKLR
jgi:dTDP-4-amino-4,6-dideoxygalactose transaminase